MAKQQTEIDIGGIKFKGGRVFLIITILSSFIGVLWGGFEAYQRYLDMEAKINSFVSPDLSGFDKKLEVLETEFNMLQSEITIILDEVALVADVAKELKNDLKADVRRIETIVEDVEQRVKEDSRENAKDLKEAIDEIKNDMSELEDKVTKQIKKALENPLSMK
jgi:chromosome segregation ATPase|tara:strand:- start:564 stop:1055 length:492 start_codon:yes stop_codon:yes gene_type:complete